MIAKLKRREFITLIGGAAAWPLAASAQQSDQVRRIGMLLALAEDDPETKARLAAFRQGLEKRGWSEGRNVRIDYRFAPDSAQMQVLAKGLVALQPDVILAQSTPAIAALQRESRTIPIVFAIGSDPVRQGLTASINRPGGNATGITSLTNEMEPKRLGLLHELVPHAHTIGVLLNPSFSQAESQLADMQQAARAMNLAVIALRANTDQDIDAAFEAVARQHVPALVVSANPFFDTRRKKLVALAARNAVPAIYHFREYVQDGGLMSYGLNFSDVYRLAGVYTGKVLKGAKPSELPVMQADKFEFVINLKTAKALGVQISDNLLSLADAVVE